MPSRAAASTPAPVDEAAQGLEDSGCAVDLVENDEALLVPGEVLFRVGQLGAVGLLLEVEVDRGALLGEVESQGRLADLARPEQCHCRKLVDELSEFGAHSP
jgi:hypothetical protein